MLVRYCYQSWSGETAAIETLHFDPPEKSIAVMPFIDLGDERNLRYFGQSLSEELINKLAKTPGLHVIARTSSFSFQDEAADVRTISRQLNVRYILEGSVRSSGSQVRVIAQFIDAVEDKHVWSSAFDFGLTDPIDLQSDIALAVSNSLHVQLAKSNRFGQSTDPITYNLFGHARHIINSRQLDRLPVAIELLQEVLRRDPNFVRGMTELAMAYYQQRVNRSSKLG